MRDPFISLTAASAVTKNLKLATGICLMIERDPITTAKEVATLDTLSNGRVILVSAGGGMRRSWKTTALVSSGGGKCCANVYSP
jgi:alkanesulfonate monooxygenase SsuD/methylene tetrahydromethanopterin reductase-like flavin-dependent oxidoreductase (luciferase family)